MKKLLMLAPLALLIVAGCGRNAKDEAPAAQDAATEGAGRPVPVSVLTVQPSRFTLTLSPGGSTEAWHEVDLAAQVAGSVASRPVELGDFVKKGDLLLGIDARLYRAQVEQAEAGLMAAEAALKQARRELERSRALKEKARISDAEHEAVELGALQAESGERAAKAALDLAKKQLEDCEIRAPFAGRVAAMHPELGEQVAPGMPACAVVDLTSVRIRSSLSERDAVRVREGMPVDIFVPALNDQRFEGVVHAMGVRSDPVTRSFPLEIRVPNPDGRLLSGMSARSSIRLEERSGALAIPVNAVVEQYGEPVAFTVTEGRASRRQLTLGPREGDLVEVLDGLRAGDKLIVRGQWSVKDGTAVETVGDAGTTQE